VRGISIKKGVKNSVHVEGIESFTTFLKELGVRKSLINMFLKYHYADGTKNGTGDIRISSAEYKKHHQNEINKINKELNKDRYIINCNCFVP